MKITVKDLLELRGVAFRYSQLTGWHPDDPKKEFEAKRRAKKMFGSVRSESDEASETSVELMEKYYLPADGDKPRVIDPEKKVEAEEKALENKDQAVDKKIDKKKKHKKNKENKENKE